MNEIHPVGVYAQDRSKLESVDPSFHDEKLLWAREQTWKVFHEIKDRLKVGMTEEDARRLAMAIFQEHGVERHWHRPFIRFGPGTMRTFRDPVQHDYTLKENDGVYIDLGPSWKDLDSDLEYEGDVGDTFTLGPNPNAETCATFTRTLFKELQSVWKEKQLSGKELYELADQICKTQDFSLTHQIDGHRLSDFPHVKHSRERLNRLEFSPSSRLWVLELHVVKSEWGVGAFFEDLLI